MTAAGHAALESELKRLMSVERPRIIELIAEARGHGDLSENAEYHAAKEAHGHNEGRIAELEDQTLARRDHRRFEAYPARHGQVRRDGDARRRGHRGEEEVPDRRRRRSRREGAARSRSPRRSPARSIGKGRRHRRGRPHPAAPAPTRSSTSNTPEFHVQGRRRRRAANRFRGRFCRSRRFLPMGNPFSSRAFVVN